MSRTMIKARPWNGKDLKGTWEVTLKIDGVRALWSPHDEQWYSRAGKPLYNIPKPHREDLRDCEVYLGNFKDTIRATRTQTPEASGCTKHPEYLSRCRSIGCKWVEGTPVIEARHLYSLDPLDSSLRWRTDFRDWALPRSHPEHLVTNPGAVLLRFMLGQANAAGYEGLVLRQGDKWLKVKPEETHDVLITGAVEGIGKHKGRLGALQTSKGAVGTGFTDLERESLWLWFLTGHSGDVPCNLEGQTIEVSCMHFTPDGKFRHPRFIRMRPDKTARE